MSKGLLLELVEEKDGAVTSPGLIVDGSHENNSDCSVEFPYSFVLCVVLYTGIQVAFDVVHVSTWAQKIF